MWFFMRHNDSCTIYLVTPLVTQLEPFNMQTLMLVDSRFVSFMRYFCQT